MKLEHINAEIRPRSSWEALDLGVQMARAWYKPLFLIWIAVSLPVFLLLFLVLFFLDLSWLSFWLVWWFKPLFERGLLHLLSRSLFEEVPSVKQTLWLIPGLLKPQWFAAITWRRFSLTRSFDLPVLQLENLKGSARSDRLSTLHRESVGVSVWLTAFCLLTEVVVAFAIYGLVILLVPREIEIDWWQVFASDHWVMNGLDNLVAYIAASLVAPFYVAGGFSLYINRRSHLEAWDVEIRFRKLIARVERSKIKNSTSSAVKNIVLILLLGFSGTLFPVDAVEGGEKGGGTPLAREEILQLPQSVSKQQIEEVLNGQLFHELTLQQQLDLDWLMALFEREDEEPIENPEWLETLLAWVERLGEFSASLAGIVEITLWSILIVLVLIVVWKYSDWFAKLLGAGSSQITQEKQAVFMFGMDISAHSLPSNLTEKARSLGERGQLRQAVSLFYRGALSQLNDRLIEQSKSPLSGSDTEGDCVRKIAQIADQELVLFVKSLVAHWQRLAYGHLELSAIDFQALCDEWAEHFERGAKGSIESGVDVNSEANFK